MIILSLNLIILDPIDSFSWKNEENRMINSIVHGRFLDLYFKVLQKMVKLNF